MKKYTKLIAIILFLAIILGCMPIVVVATETETSQEQTLQETEVETTVTDELVLYDSQEIVSDEIIGEVVELESLREENVKHFRLSNGAYEAVSYGQAVHRKDADGVWQDINNDLTLKTVGTKQLYTTSDERVSFNKEANAATLSENGYSISMTLLTQQSSGNISSTDNATLMTVAVDNQSVARAEYYDTLEQAIEINNKSSIVYSNVMANTDIEYIMSGNDLKENIIVKAKGDSYVYGFQLALSGLVPVLENNVISLRDETTDEEKYIIPAPYMYDANGEYSYDVEYGLIHAGGEKYLLTVTANEEWINDESRALPVTIDPAIETSSNTEDTFINSVAASANYGNNSIMSVNSDSISLIRIDIPTLPSGSMFLGANLIVKYYFSSSLPSDKVTQARQILGSWSESTVNYNNKPNIRDTVLSSVSMTKEDGQSFNAPSTAEYDITDAVNNWYAGESNYGIAIMHTSGYEVAAQLKTSECNDDDYPYISINYLRYIPNGVYALQNVLSSSNWVAVEDKNINDDKHDGVWAGNGLKQIYFSTPPAESFAIQNNINANAGLFKISRIGNGAQYVLRSMLNNNLCLGVSSNGDVVTKNIPSADSNVSSYYMFNFIWRGDGFILQNCGTGQLISSEYNSNNIKAIYNVEDMRYASWNLVQYTGIHKSGLTLYSPSSWKSIGIVQGESGEATAVGWSTHIDANTINLNVSKAYSKIVSNSITSPSIIVTANKPGTFKINVHILYSGGMTVNYAAFEAVVVPPQGLYFIKNMGTGKCIDIENDSRLENAFLEQKTFSNVDSQWWILEHATGNAGYIRLTSVYSNFRIGVDSSDSSLIKQYNPLSDHILWKVETTTAGYLKFTCKVTTNTVLSVSSSTDGLNLTQSNYSDDTNYNDEWSLCEHFLFINHYYDKGFEIRLSMIGTPQDMIADYQRTVEKRFLDMFGLALFSNGCEYFPSIADDCKISTSSTNSVNAITINQPCTHSSLHTTPTALRNQLLSKINQNNTPVNATIIWTGHEMENKETSNTVPQLSSIVITPANLFSATTKTEFEISYINTLMHELSHILGTIDHYCKATTSTACDNANCDMCVLKYATVRQCITGNIAEDISTVSDEDIYCSECDGTIQSHLNHHHILS